MILRNKFFFFFDIIFAGHVIPFYNITIILYKILYKFIPFVGWRKMCQSEISLNICKYHKEALSILLLIADPALTPFLSHFRHRLFGDAAHMGDIRFDAALVGHNSGKFPGSTGHK